MTPATGDYILRMPTYRDLFQLETRPSGSRSTYMPCNNHRASYICLPFLYLSTSADASSNPGEVRSSLPDSPSIASTELVAITLLEMLVESQPSLHNITEDTTNLF